MIQRYALSVVAMAILIGVVALSPVRADTSATIDFEGLIEGSTVSSLSCGSGITCPGNLDLGTVTVTASNQNFPNGENTAMTFDAECRPRGIPADCSGGDFDLFFPGHGNTLINSEDLDGNDPDDQALRNSFMEFDFSAFGPGLVTVDDIDVGDIEPREDGAFLEAFVGGCTGSSLGITNFPLTGNNWIQNMVVNISGVDCLRVHLNGSGTIDNIQITPDDPITPAIDIEKWTRIMVAPAVGDVCKNLGKPKLFTLRYTGENTLDHHQKEDKVKVNGELAGESQVRIISKKGFDGTVELGETFDTEKGKVIIQDLKGQVLKKIEFHTSCSQPLVLGDHYGGVQLVGYTSKDGNSASFAPTPDAEFGEDADEPAGPKGRVGDPLIWTYFVTNTGDSPLHNVTIVDDSGTPADTSDDFSPDFVSGDENGNHLLDLTETWMYQARGRVQLGEYKNIGRVSGVDPVGTEVTDEDPSHHSGVFPAGDVCKTLGKLQRLTMLYTGDNVLDHSQGDKVRVTGDPDSEAVVHIISAEKSNGTGNIYFESDVKLGTQFDIDATRAGKDKLKSNTSVLVYDLKGYLLQEINFHTSCSRPLEPGNQFGGIQLISVTDQDGNGT